MATLTQFITQLRAKTATRIFKIEVLDSNENVVDEITTNVLSGDIQNTDDDGSRRSANIVFDNSDGDFLPDPDGTIWMNTKFKISTGLIVGDDEYYVSRGIFLCSEPEIGTSHDGTAITSIQFLDKFNLLNGVLGGALETTYVIPVSTNIGDAVVQLLSDAGITKPPIIEATTELTPYTITKPAGNTYGDILIELAKIVSYTTYFDENGYLRFEPRSNIETTGSKWDFATNEVSYLGNQHRYEFSKVYNKVVVVGDNINGSIVRGEASDTNVSSPTRIALIGTKTKVIEDDLISSTPLATQRAEYELQLSISLVETTDMTVLPIDIISAGDIITITDLISDLNADRFLVKSLSFPLTIDSDMRMNCWKGRTLT